MDINRTITAISTSYGIGGIGIIRISGKQSFFILKKLVKKNMCKNRYAYHAEIYDFNHIIIDNGIILKFKKPYSYTGEDVVEIHSHGNYILLEKILSTICFYGAIIAKPGEFTYRAFINKKIDLLQAESINNLIHAQTLSAAKAAQRSLKGDFSRVINNIIDNIIQLRIYIESTIDFAEEDIDDITEKNINRKLLKIINYLNEVFELIKSEEKINREIKIVITGEPNVGKSTLINKISKNQISIVTKYAGTTRDLVKSKISLNGTLIEIVDTAGIHESSNIIEKYGIKIAKEEIKKSDIKMNIICAEKLKKSKYGIVSYVKKLIKKKKEKEILVINKIDLLKKQEIKNLTDIQKIILISAKKSIGIKNLIKKIDFLLKKYHSVENNFLARKRHLTALKKSLKYLKKSYSILNHQGNFEFLANELYLSQLSLEEVTGQFTSDDLLGRIFSEFCIGK